MNKSDYQWRYCSIGGATRVCINKGEDIAHIGELDQKLWTTLSCPTTGLEFDKEFLSYVDTDKDGRIRVKEVINACEWVCSILKNREELIASKSQLALSAIDLSTPNGQNIEKSARKIIECLRKEDKEHIELADTINSEAIFANTQFNGDGIITAATAGDDESLRHAIEDCLKCFPALKDRSGNAGVDTTTIQKFYEALSGYDEWVKSGQRKECSPFGTKTVEVYALVKELKPLIDAYFTRCEYFAYDPQCKEGEDSIESISHPNTQVLLHLDKINPQWVDKVREFQRLAISDNENTLSKERWSQVQSLLKEYENWLQAKTGSQVESLGINEVELLLEQSRQKDIIDLINKDITYKDEADGIDDVHKFLVLYSHLFEFLNNFIVFGAFYDRTKKSAFDAGELYIDQRCLKLCIKVSDMSKQIVMAPQSGMYILYCDCISKSTGKQASIAAIITNGDTDNLSVGMNAVFYDRNGLDYDAVVTRIIDNPTSIRQAFLYPYKKFAKAISDRINKRAAEKESKVSGGLVDLANGNVDSKGSASVGKKPFDATTLVALTAGLGVGAGMILNAVSALVKPWYTLLLVIAGLCLVISGPSMFLAWVKLRKRNLAPILNANGWAINSSIIVNSLFGATLTSLAKYPKILNVGDPFAQKKKSPVPGILLTILIIAVIVIACLYFTGHIGK